MPKTITVKLPVVIAALTSLLVLFAVSGVFIWKEHQNNTNLSAEVSQQTKADKRDYAMYSEVARRLADLQLSIGSPDKISYVLPYSNELYNGDQSSPYMTPNLYREGYDGLDNCDYGLAPVVQDIVKDCKDNADAVYRAWNP